MNVLCICAAELFVQDACTKPVLLDTVPCRLHRDGKWHCLLYHYRVNLLLLSTQWIPMENMLGTTPV